MRVLMATAIALAAVTLASAADVPRSFVDARANWEKTKDSAEYQAYASEFVQYNNHFHIDERGGCYALGQGQVSLMLVITHASGTEFAVIEAVLSDVDSPKAQCFAKSYAGLKTKVPPYLPFVLQMTIG